MKYVELNGNNILNNIDVIRNEFSSETPCVFVYNASGTLYDYIEDLYNNGLNTEELYKFKICYEKKDLNASHEVSYVNEEGKNIKKFTSIKTISDLINILDPEKECRIVVDNDNRSDLAFIVQQLIFINYPLEKIDILLRKEESDANRTKRFMNYVEELYAGCKKAIENLTELQKETASEPEDEFQQKRLNDVTNTLESSKKIEAKIEKARDVELKFAIAASKKAGKSMIANSFLGEEIAPTSTELATPNNCIYRKSKDKFYHLKLEGETPEQTFSDRKAIHEVINKYFRDAQNNKEAGFVMPDMEIEYATKENNFSSYTIFDTAGPDAAGTKHKEVAMQAMEKCDVALFAIDYSKYLTVTEEEYLREIKEMFSRQNKFHSLIIALNKIDTRYTDPNTPKSVIKQIDFIKTRLSDIDENYKETIIFPTCSLEYFDAIDAENAGAKELCEEVAIDDMKKIKFNHRDIETLAWLHSHSENLEYYHGFKKISYDILKKDSGMPALMNYVSYVATSKARDEIVNNITWEINLNRNEIQQILDNIQNIESMINSSEDKIGEITKILEEYEKDVKEIMKDDFDKETELDKLLAPDSLLKSLGGDFDSAIGYFKNYLLKNSRDIWFVNIYNKIVRKMWERIETRYRQQGDITGNDINALISQDECQKIVDEEKGNIIESALHSVETQMKKVNQDVKKIFNDRKARIETRNEECKQELLKLDFKYNLPELPTFEYSAEIPNPDNIHINLGYLDLRLFDNLHEIFEKTFWSKIKSFLPWVDKKDPGHTRNLPNREVFYATCQQSIKDKVTAKLTESKVDIQITEAISENVINKYLKELIGEQNKSRKNFNKILKDGIERFSDNIDDREKYKEDIERYNKRRETIDKINEGTADFMETWNKIVDDVCL